MVERCLASCRRGARRVLQLGVALATLIAMLVLVAAMPTVHASADDAPAGDGTPSAEQSTMATSNNVTDTQNLLGDHIAQVDDAISATHAKDGVTVRLLYLAQFDQSKDASQWASDVLESTKPQPNTVLLAVASDDGNLVIAVSPNSEQWLKDSVSELSDAAVKPLNEKTPNWPGSALALMNKIDTLKQTSTPPSVSRASVVAWVLALAALVVTAVVFVLLRVRARRSAHAGHAGGR